MTHTRVQSIAEPASNVGQALSRVPAVDIADRRRAVAAAPATKHAEAVPSGRPNRYCAVAAALRHANAAAAAARTVSSGAAAAQSRCYCAARSVGPSLEHRRSTGHQRAAAVAVAMSKRVWPGHWALMGLATVLVAGVRRTERASMAAAVWLHTLQSDSQYEGNIA